jgi:single-strand DNA-binding protein
MINAFQGIGNLGTTPTLKAVDCETETRKVANMRVYFDRPVGEDFKDKGGFWLSVDIWGFRAEEAHRILKKGARVYFSGALRQESWTDEMTGEIRHDMRLSADYFFIDSVCIDSIQFREKNRQRDDRTAQPAEA